MKIIASFFVPTNKWFLQLLIGLLIVSAGALSSSCRSREDSAEPLARPVVTETVGEPAEGRVRTFAGVTRGEVETPISFRVSGEIAELLVQAGDSVEADQVIARLDPVDLELNVQRLMAQQTLAESQERQAAAEYQRIQALFEANTASRSEFDRARANRDAAEAQRETATAALNQARTQLAHATRHSPHSGTIISVPANLYQFVSPGQPIAILRADRGIILEVAVAELLAGDLTIGQPATLTIEAFPGQEFTGQVSEIGAGLTGLAAIPVQIRIDEPPTGIRSGQAGEARISFKEDLHGITIPLAAVTGATGEQRFAWVVDPDTEQVQRRSIEVGSLIDERIEVTSGLEPGEKIVVRGANRLSDGQRVRLLP